VASRFPFLDARRSFALSGDRGRVAGAGPATCRCPPGVPSPLRPPHADPLKPPFTLSPRGGAATPGKTPPPAARPRPRVQAPPPGLTAQQDAAQQALPPLQRVAVPAVPAELVLALGGPGGHAAADGEHGVGVPPAQLPLAAHQARHVVAHHPGRAHGAHVPAGEGEGQRRGAAGPGAAAACAFRGEAL